MELKRRLPLEEKGNRNDRYLNVFICNDVNLRQPLCSLGGEDDTAAVGSAGVEAADKDWSHISVWNQGGARGFVETSAT